MCKSGPGKSQREAISLPELFRKFPDDKAAQSWFVSILWPSGPRCPRCKSSNVLEKVKHPSMTHRCRDCGGRPLLSLKTGNIMEGSNLGYQAWAIAIYLFMTSLKGVASLKMRRGPKAAQTTAWFLGMRFRDCAVGWLGLFKGPVEADETYIGGKRKSMSAKRRWSLRKFGRGGAGKATVAGGKDRAANQAAAKVVETADRSTLHDFIRGIAERGALIYTDEA